MAQDRLTEKIRASISHTFQGFGCESGQPMSETILIRDGFYCGRRFDCDGLQAVWFAEEGQVKFFDRDGQLLEVLDTSALLDQRRVA